MTDAEIKSLTLSIEGLELIQRRMATKLTRHVVNDGELSKEYMMLCELLTAMRAGTAM